MCRRYISNYCIKLHQTHVMQKQNTLFMQIHGGDLSRAGKAEAAVACQWVGAATYQLGTNLHAAIDLSQLGKT